MVNFWWLIARQAIDGRKFGKSSTTGLSRIVYMVKFKSLAGKILTGLDKSAKILLYNIMIIGAHCDKF